MRAFLVVFLPAVLCFGLTTLLALEGREVVVLRTTDADGNPRRTRTWIAAEDGALWVEAANPTRAFLDDLRRRPALVLERRGVEESCTAEIQANPDGHAHIRRLLLARYGWADRWIGVLADTSRSLAVRLTCA